MAKIAREDRQVSTACSRCDGNVGKAGRMARRTRVVHQLSRQTRCRIVEGNHPLAVKMEHEFEPVVEARGSCGGPDPSQPGDAAANLCDCDGGQEQGVGMFIHPPGERCALRSPAGCPGGEDVGIDQIQGAGS